MSFRRHSHNQQLTGTAVENLCVSAGGGGAITQWTGVCVWGGYIAGMLKNHKCFCIFRAKTLQSITKMFTFFNVFGSH